MKSKLSPNLVNFFLDPKVELQDKLDVMLEQQNHSEIDERVNMMMRCGYIFCYGYMDMVHYQVEEDYEKCAIYRNFLNEFKKLYHIAIKVYPDYTYRSFKFLDKIDEDVKNKLKDTEIIKDKNK